jgi:D-glycero-D-manno-heptose 1,7-bisphosphate phosphatase
MQAPIRRAVFFDRDGVINELVDRGEDLIIAGERAERTAPWIIEELRIHEGAADVIASVQALGYLAIIVTNQPDMYYGFMEAHAFKAIMDAVRGLGFNDAFACTHGYGEGCACRKPAPGMLYEAIAKWGIDPRASYMVGDMESDLIAAQAAGVTPILIERPYNGHIHAERRIKDLREIPFFLKK